MATAYLSAPVPLWALNTNIGLPNVNGFMRAYQDNNRSILKNVFKDQSGTQAYSQPITFGASAQRGPFYWEVSDPPNKDDVYFLEIFDVDGGLIKTIESFAPAGTGGGSIVTVNQDFNNIIPNGQFRFVHKTSITSTPISGPVAYGGWIFEKNDSSATDEIKFNTLALGDDSMTLSPTREFEYECTGIGGTETFKHLECRLRDVRTLQNKPIHIRFEAKFAAGSNSLPIELVQNFGSGGSPSALVVTPVTTFTLGATYGLHEINFTVPSLSGKNLGTEGTDYLALRFVLPIQQTAQIFIDNVQITSGNDNLEYQYDSTNKSVGDILPPIEPGLINRRLSINGDGELLWGEGLPIGSIIIWSVPSIPFGWAECDGVGLGKIAFPALFAVLGDYYGADATFYNLPDYRGYFLRGVDGSAGRDPDSATRTPATNGTATTVGSTQVDEFASHTHNVAGTLIDNVQGGGADGVVEQSLGATSATGGSETRPKNIYVTYIIKVL